VTVLLPCTGPKPKPTIVIEAPAGADVGDKLLMVGATLNVTALLTKPSAVVTITLPVVAATGTIATISVVPQAMTAATVPLKVILPTEEPKVLPSTVTDIPADPNVGDRLLMLGVTVKSTALLSF